MNNIYLYSLRKHPLLWITFPFWILFGIIFALARQQESPRRR